MSDISQGSHVKLILNPGDVMRISTAGSATVLAAYGAPAGMITISANTQEFGPYQAPAKLILTANIGAASYRLLGSDANAGYTDAQALAAAKAGIPASSIPAASVPKLNTLAALSLPLSDNDGQYEYTGKVITKRGRVARSRVLRDSAPLADATSGAAGTWPAATTAANVTVSTTTDDALTSPSQHNYVGTSTGFNIDYTGLNLKVPDNGLFYLPIRLDDFEAYGIGPVLALSVYTSDGNRTNFQRNSNGCYPGSTNFFTCFDMTTALPGGFVRGSNSTATAAIGTGALAGKTITRLNLQASVWTPGLSLSISQPVTGEFVKPMVEFTNDVTTNSTWDYFFPAMQAAGLRAVVRIGGNSETSFAASFIANVRMAIAAGWEANHGTYSRPTMNGSTLPSLVISEVLNVQNRVARWGIPSMTLLAGSGNSNPSFTVARRTLPKLGIRRMKYAQGPGYINTMQAGGDDQLFHTVHGPTTFASFKAVYDALKISGGLYTMFFHEWVVSGATGTATLQSEMDQIIALVKADVAAGLVDCIVPSEYDAMFSPMAERPVITPGTAVQVAQLAGIGTSAASLYLSEVLHKDASLVLTGAPILGLQDLMGEGLRCRIIGAMNATTPFVGTAVVTDDRTAGYTGTTPEAMLLQTGQKGDIVGGSALAHDTYLLKGQKA